MDLQAELLTDIESFLAQHGAMAETTFGKLAVNDGKFVRRLREGSNMTLGTINRVKEYLRAQRLADASPPPAPEPLPRKRRRANPPQDSTPPEPSASHEQAA